MGSIIAVLTQPTYGNIALTELIWTGIGVIGLIVTIFAVIDTYKDFKILAISQTAVPETVWMQANLNLLSEVLRVVIMIGVLVVGIYAMLQPSPLKGPQPLTTVAIVLTAVLCFIVVSTITQSALSLRYRYAIRSKLSASE